MAAAVGATRDGRGHRLLAGRAGSPLVHGYSGLGRGPAPRNRDRTFAGASVVAILALSFPFLTFHSRMVAAVRAAGRSRSAPGSESTSNRPTAKKNCGMIVSA